MTKRKLPRKPAVGKPATKGEAEREIDHNPEDAANTKEAANQAQDDSFTIDQGRRLASDTPKSEPVPDSQRRRLQQRRPER